MAQVTIYVSDDLKDQIDEQRGDLSRSGWIQQAIKEKLAEPDEEKRLNELEHRLELLRKETTHSRTQGFFGEPYSSWKDLKDRHDDGPPQPF